MHSMFSFLFADGRSEYKRNTFFFSLYIMPGFFCLIGQMITITIRRAISLLHIRINSSVVVERTENINLIVEDKRR